MSIKPKVEIELRMPAQLRTEECSELVAHYLEYDYDRDHEGGEWLSVGFWDDSDRPEFPVENITEARAMLAKLTPDEVL